MTNEEKVIILKLRDEGKGYGEIAKITGISKNSISAFLRRDADKKYDRCLACGKKLIQTPGHRQKLFCNDNCRKLNWIQKGRKSIKMKAFKCKFCGRTFFGYESQHPSFCSRECYFKSRRGDANGTN